MELESRKQLVRRLTMRKGWSRRRRRMARKGELRKREG